MSTRNTALALTAMAALAAGALASDDAAAYNGRDCYYDLITNGFTVAFAVKSCGWAPRQYRVLLRKYHK